MKGCMEMMGMTNIKKKKMLIEHNRYKSVDEQQYGKYNHNKMFDVGKGNYSNNSNSNSSNYPGRTRSTIGGNFAFCEANNFIARRKMLQKNSSNHNLLLNKNKLKPHNEGTHTVFLRRAMSSSIIPSNNNNNHNHNININSNQGESSSQIYLQGSTMNSNNNNNNK